MVSLLVLLSLFFSPELLSLSKKVTAVAPPSLMQLYRLSRDADTSRLVRKIKLQLPAMEKTNKVLAYEFLWALGLYHKRRGELIWARRYYSKALQWQKHPALLVNFGNVEAIAQKGAKARDAYKLAMKKDSSVEEARYNLMRITQNSVTRRKFQNLSVENEFRSRKVFAFLRSSQKQVNRYLMDVDLPDSRFWELYNAWLLKWRDLETHWSQVCSVLPFQARPFFGGAALLLFVLLWLFRRRLFPERKSKLLVLETQELTLEERTSRSLLLEYRERMKFRIHLFLSFFVMGSDKVLDGKLFSGFLRILFVSWVAALWLGQGFVFSHPWSLGGSLLGGKWLLTGITIVFGLLALGNVRRVWNQSGRRSERE